MLHLYLEEANEAVATRLLQVLPQEVENNEIVIVLVFDVVVKEIGDEMNATS